RRSRRRTADAGLDRQGRTDAAQGRLPEEHGDLSRPRVRGVGAFGRRVMSAARNLLFLLFQLVVTPFYAAVFLLMFWLPRVPRYKIARNWCRVNLWAVRLICGIRWRVIGQENIPATPHVIMCKHSSTWETLALNLYFPPLAFVAKKELLKIPFFGWGF